MKFPGCYRREASYWAGQLLADWRKPMQQGGGEGDGQGVNESTKVDHLDIRGKLSSWVIMLFSALQSSFLAPNHWIVCVQIAGRRSSFMQANIIFLFYLCNYWGLLKSVPSSTKASWCRSWHLVSLLGRDEFINVIAKGVCLHRTMDETAAYSTFVLWRYLRCKMISTHCNIIGLKKTFDGTVNIYFLYLMGILLLLTLLNIAVLPWPRCASIF